MNSGYISRAPFRPGPINPFRRNRSPLGGKAWLLIFVVGVALFIAQGIWMKQTRARRALDVDASLIFKLSNLIQDDTGAATSADPSNVRSSLGTAASGTAGLPNGTELVPCELCTSLGLVAEPETGESMPCPLCQGHGSRLIRRLSPADQLCPACGGIGATLNPDHVTASVCERCGGRGLIAGKAADVPAPEAAAAP